MMKPTNSFSLRLFSGSLFLLVCILSACGGNNNNGFFARGLIGSEGGTITTADGMLTLEVPAQALVEPTEITVTRVTSDVSSLLFYEFTPSGLQFQTPARMTVDVSSIMENSNSENLSAAALPGVITTAADGQGVEVLGNLQLLMDGDANTFLLGGDVSHFSKFVLGGKTSISLSVEKVPQFWPAHTDFGPVEVNISNDADNISAEPISFINYLDSSIAEVFIKGQPFQSLFPAPNVMETKTYKIPYRCGEPAVGTYKASISFTSITTEFVLEYEPEEINIASAFLFGAAGPVIEGGESVSRYASRYNTYTVHGTRKVNCGGSTPIEDPTPVPTPSGQDTSGDPLVTPEPTPGNEPPPAQPTPANQPPATPPSITTDTTKINIDHTMGETGCPTNGAPIIVKSSSANPLTVMVSESLSFLNVNPSSATTSGGQAQFTPSFPCTGFQLGMNTGTITITAKDPSTGLSSNELVIPVMVNVQ